MESVETLSWLIMELGQQGYVADLNCPHSVIWAEPEAFQIEAVYRFEGPTDPADASILYAISSDKFHIKGVLINAYGVYADTLAADLVQTLRE